METPYTTNSRSYVSVSRCADVTYGVSSIGNMQALLMSLTSILLGHTLPAKILIRLEGKMPEFGNFYLEQMAELARFKNVDFQISVANSKGARFARDWLMDECRTPYLWMGDDDVIYAPHCLKTLVASLMELLDDSDECERFAYLNGNKPDLNNRRGYDDFKVEVVDSQTVRDNTGYNFFFDGPNTLVRNHTADTGNLLIAVNKVKAAGVRFQAFEEEYNSGGEDSLFAMMCHKAGLRGWLATRADAYHLEKPAARFNEFAARKNMLARAAELKGLDKSALAGVFPWLVCKK